MAPIPPPSPNSSQRLLYVTDPMCSWCWGFAPTFERITQTVASHLPVTIVLGGLRPGTTHSQTADEKASQKQHWRNVQRASGQPFDFTFFERPAFVYDTEPAARAVVVARRQGSDRAHQLLAAVQEAFYRDNRDVTDEAQLVDLAAACGFDATTFAADLRNDAARAETQADFALVRRLGIHGFPTVLGQSGVLDQNGARGEDHGHLTMLAAGYSPWLAVQPVLERWLRQGAGHEAG